MGLISPPKWPSVNPFSHPLGSKIGRKPMVNPSKWVNLKSNFLKFHHRNQVISGIEKAREMAYSRVFLALLSCRLALGELGCIAGRAAPCTRCLSKDLQRHRLAPCGATAGDAQSCSPVIRESRQQKTALPKQSRKDTSETNQRLENWGARRAAFRPYFTKPKLNFA